MTRSHHMAILFLFGIGAGIALLSTCHIPNIKTAMANRFPQVTAALLAAFPASSAHAALYSLSESASFSHTSNSNNFGAAASGSNWAAGSTPLANGAFSWGTLATDTTANTATFGAGGFTASDWGGDGTYTSVTIDVSGLEGVNIAYAGSSTFNSVPTEYFHFFYQVDGGGLQTFGSLIASGTVTGTQSVLLSGNTSLVVGFRFNHNGASDNATVTELSVTAIPEPAAAMLGSLGLLALLRRRR